MTDMMDALQIAMILDDLKGLSDVQWKQLQDAENNRRALLNPLPKNEPFTQTKTLVNTMGTMPSIGQRIKFAAHTRPMRIAGRTGIVKEILAKGNVKIEIDGTSEVFTRVPRLMYDIVDQDVVVAATKKAQRRSRYSSY